jgi:hypothetical protein
VVRLEANAFLAITELASEWSLATDGKELVMFARLGDNPEIYEFRGPNAFGYSNREMIVFAFRVLNKVKLVRGK